MVTKKKIVIDTDFDLDTSLDFDLNFTEPSLEDNRKPIIKFATAIPAGATSTLRDTNFIKNRIKEVLPKGFGETIDLADRTKASIKNLYDESVSEMRPAIKELKRTASKLVPPDSKVVPKFIKELLEQWKRDNEPTSNQSISGQREAMLSQQMGEIFKAQTEQGIKLNVEQEGRDRLKEGMELSRHKDMFSLTNASRIHLSRIDQFNTGINLQYQKKSLELQYRNLFAIQDLIEHNKRISIDNQDSMLKLIKNTALSDDTKQVVKNKFSDKTGFSLFSNNSNIIDNMFKGLNSKIKDQVGGLSQGILEGLSQAEQAKEMTDNMDKSTMAGTTAGSLTADYLGSKLGKHLRGKLTGSWLDKKLGITQKGDALSLFNDNKMRLLTEFKKNQSYANMEGVTGGVLSFLQGIIPSTTVDTKADVLGSKDMDGKATYTRRTERSINDIIPGYLARIYQELQITRTGNGDIELTKYDHDSNGFMNASSAQKAILNSIIDKKSVDYTREGLDSMLDKIDPNKKLSNEARSALKKKLLKNSSDNRLGNEANLASDNSYEGFTKEIKDELIPYMKKFMSSMSDGDKRSFQMDHNKLADNVADKREEIQNHIAIGNIGELKSLGLVKGGKSDKSIDYDKDKISDILKAFNPSNKLASQIVNAFKKKLEENRKEGVKSDPASASFYRGMPDIAGSTLIPIARNFGGNTDTTIDIDKILEYYVGEGDLTAKESAGSTDPLKFMTDKAKKSKGFKAEVSSIFDSVKDTTSSLFNNSLGAVKDMSGNFNNLLKPEDTKASIINEPSKLNDLLGANKVPDKIINEPQDLYVSGETNPRITAAGLKAGIYRDKDTNETITHQDQIKGDVVDNKNNTVISKTDMLRLKYFNLQTKAYEMYENGKTKAIGLYGVYMPVINTKFQSMSASLKSNFNNLLTSFNEVKDVYVDGETEPRLFAVKIKAGNYRNKDSNSVLTDPTKIEGDVVDENNTVVIRKEELGKLKVYEPAFKKFKSLRIVGKGLIWMLGGLWHYQTKIAPKWTAWNFKMLGKGLGIIKDVGMAVIRGDRVKDVYVGNEKEPRLYASRMNNGEYFLTSTGKVISHQNQISGEIKDSEGNVVINEEDLDNLRVYDSVFKWLNPFKLAGLALKGIAKAGKFVVSKLWTASKAMFKVTSGLLVSGISKIVRAITRPTDVYLFKSNKPILLAKLMAAGQYVCGRTGKIIKIVADIVGPVLNANTGNTIISEEEFNKGLYDISGKPLKKGIFSKIGTGLGKLNKLFSYRRSFKTRTLKDLSVQGLTKSEALTTRSIDLLQDIKDILGKANKKNGKKDQDIDPVTGKVKKGAIATAGAGLASLVPGLKKDEPAKDGGTSLTDIAGGTVAGMVGKSIMGRIAGAVGLSSLASLLGTGAAATTATAGAATAGAGVLGTIGAIGGSIGAFLASPVVLGAAAVGLVGYGAYKLYKYNQRDKLDTYELIRYVQYGFSKNQTKYAAQVLALEDYCKDFITKALNGSSMLNESKMDVSTLLGFFDTDPKDSNIFFQWFKARFIPVYLTHMTAIKAIDSKLNLSDIEKLSTEQKKVYVNAIKFPEGPYNFTQLPIADMKDVQVSTINDINTVITDVLKGLIDGGTLDNQDAKNSKAAFAAPRNALGKAMLVDSATATKVGLIGTGAISTTTKLSGTAMSVSGNGMYNPGISMVGALDAVRYKVYGIKETDAEKIKALQMLESKVLPNVKFDAKFVATWEGNPSAVLTECLGVFGISNIAGNEANSWYTWFRNRFLPTYMAYLSYSNALIGKLDSTVIGLTMKMVNQLELARILVGISGIWSISDSPWTNYQIGTDAKVCDPNLLFLDDAAKKIKLQEQSKEPTDYSEGNPNPPKKPSFLDKLFGRNTTTPNGDSEEKVTGGSVAANGGITPGKIVQAGGKLFDGRGASGYLALNSGVSLAGTNPGLLKAFYGMVEEYGNLTGKKVGVTSGFRSYEQQAAEYKRNPNGAAPPGNSMHESGLALDVNSETLDEMDKLGLMRKYGLTRPVGSEPWHLEPIGVQANRMAYVGNPGAAEQAINAGTGLGGGGLGAIRGTKIGRDNNMSAQIMAMSTPTIDPKNPSAAPTPSTANVNTPTTTPPPVTGAIAPPPKQGVLAQNGNTPTTSGDNEGQPKAVNTTRASLIPLSGVIPTNGPADPTVRIPDPKGNGYAGMKDVITAAAKLVGVDPDLMLKTAAVESGFDANAKNSKSSAGGLFQFIDKTWNEMISKYGPKYGYTLANTSPLDPKANSIMAAHYIKDVSASVSRSTGKPMTATDAYISHFMGATGAGKFLNTVSTSPDTLGTTFAPKSAEGNKGIFYDGDKPRTVGQIYALLDKRVNEKARSFGMDAGSGPMPGIVLASNTNTSNSNGYVPPRSNPNIINAGYTPAAIPSSENSYTPTPKPSPLSIITDNAATSPIANAYGLTPITTSNKNVSAPANQLTSEVMKDTNSILTQSLKVQTESLDVLKKLFNITDKRTGVSNPVDAPKTENKTPNTPGVYSPPTVPVPMKRQVV